MDDWIELWSIVRKWPWRGSSDWFRRRVCSETPAVALESGPGYGELGRWSLFTWEPEAVFTVRGGDWTLRHDNGWPTIQVPGANFSALDSLRSLIRQTQHPLDAVDDGNALPFRGGWIGFIGYDFSTQLEGLSRRHPPSALPDMCWMYFPWAYLLDRVQGRFILVTDGRFDDELWQRREAEMRRREGRIISTCPESLTSFPSPALTPPASDWSKPEYIAAVERLKEYIRAGDVFQANLTHRFSTTLHPIWSHPNRIADLWDRCVQMSPAPFSALIKTPVWSVLSTSPERFLLVEPDGRVETRPIKGTRPRGATAKEDAAMMSALLASAKDRAELAMIVDLERNDLGRVCEFGSVKVAQHAALESYSNVHHLVSTVEGKLRPGMDVVDLLAAAFPGGSITGAPKIRAMEIIDELEGCSRGIYTGAIGYISDHGRADFNIAIRTLVVEGDQAHYHVGGGITEGSDPVAEYEETLAKGSKLMRVLTEET
jgi:para-aminobenzoate synthetase component 1